jgi:rubrerythrin
MYARTTTRDHGNRWQCEGCGFWCDPDDRPDDGSHLCPVCAEEEEEIDAEEAADDEEVER